MLDDISICLAALYLRGAPRNADPPKRRWRKVEACLRLADCELAKCPAALMEAGFWEEALVLEDKRLTSFVSELQSNGAISTAANDGYPRRWLERLRAGAPPAFWLYGRLSTRSYVGIVGCRHIDRDARDFAVEIGREAVRLGYAVVSGGAAGADTGGAFGALSEGGEVTEILPYGIDLYRGSNKCGLALCKPDEQFSTASAMERNGLIYGAAERTVVVASRFKEGGTWTGAVDANRRRLCPLIVRDDRTPASRALIALGGIAITDPHELSNAMAKPAGHPGLFGGADGLEEDSRR